MLAPTAPTNHLLAIPDQLACTELYVLLATVTLEYTRLLFLCRSLKEAVPVLVVIVGAPVYPLPLFVIFIPIR